MKTKFQKLFYSKFGFVLIFILAAIGLMRVIEAIFSVITIMLYGCGDGQSISIVCYLVNGEWL